MRRTVRCSSKIGPSTRDEQNQGIKAVTRTNSRTTTCVSQLKLLSAVLGEAEKLRASNKRRARHLAEASEQVTRQAGKLSHPQMACMKPVKVPGVAPTRPMFEGTVGALYSMPHGNCKCTQIVQGSKMQFLGSTFPVA